MVFAKPWVRLLSEKLRLGTLGVFQFGNADLALWRGEGNGFPVAARDRARTLADLALLQRHLHRAVNRRHAGDVIAAMVALLALCRSEERRVGKESRCRWAWERRAEHI